MTQTTTTFKIIGVTDDSCVCEKCGKTNLKKVVVLENMETGEIVRYGTDCASRAMGVKKATVDMEFDLIAKINRWIAKGATINQVVEGLRNQGYGAEYKNGQLHSRGLTTPMTL